TRGLLQLEARIHAGPGKRQRHLIITHTIRAPRHQVGLRVLQRSIMQVPLDVEARAHTGSRRLEDEGIHGHPVDVDGRRAGAAARLAGRRRAADGSPGDIRGTDVDALDVHVPRKERERRPVDRNALRGEPYALRVAQLEARNVDLSREGPPEACDAYASRGELCRLALQE